jgi:outer membrane protein assembly factor BamB
VTCWTGYGADRNVTDPKDLARVLVCVDERDGTIVWQKEVKTDLPEDPYNGFLRDHGYASNTPATDGERVYVLFGKSGVVAFDLAGNQLWQKSVGIDSHPMGWGSAASPIVYKNLVIVNAAAAGRALYAFDGKTGRQVWKNPASSLTSCWGTPVLVDVPGGKQELAISVPFEIWGLDPDTGDFLWFSEGVRTMAACTSLVARDGVVYCVAGGPGQSGAVAIRAGGRDDVTQTHRLWSKTLGSYVPSPVLVGDYLYWVNNDGIAACIKRETGDQVYSQQRIPDGGQFYASLTAAGDKLYAVSRERGTFVLAARPEFEVLAHNTLDSDAGTFNASPAVGGGKLILRSNKYLYCIGPKK